MLISPVPIEGDEQEIPPEDELPSASVGNVTVKVDQLARPGALVSGRGAALSKYGFDALTQPKSFHLREI